MEWLLTAQEVGTFISTFGVLLAAVFTVAAAVYGFFKQRADNAKLIADAAEIRDVRIEIRDAPQLSQQQYTLLREYHAQGLAQSKISFWFSLIFASLGFSVIMLGVGLVLSQDVSQLSIATVQKPMFTLVSGAVIDAVAALFFVQSNRARQLMAEFFDKLRVDRKLDEPLRLANEIADPKIQSSLKTVLALNFAEVGSASEVLTSVLGSSPSSLAAPPSAVGNEAVIPFEGTKAPSLSR